jgi:excinuclease ABC subunit B
LEEEMVTAAQNLEFEKAALLRDQIREVKRMAGDESGASAKVGGVSYKEKKGRKPKRRGVKI